MLSGVLPPDASETLGTPTVAKRSQSLICSDLACCEYTSDHSLPRGSGTLGRYGVGLSAGLAKAISISPNRWQ